MNLHRLGRAAVFLAGSVIGGLALAFIIVFVHPQLLQRPEMLPITTPPPQAAPEPSSSAVQPPPEPQGTPAPQPSPGMAAESYAAAVRRAAPAVVNISTARLVTEQIGPSALAQLFGDLRPLYRRRVERALGSGVIVD
ncbi:MAG TPA: hypothetical protein VGH84_09875, partial [Steroidobacteraceae bacterium]